MQRSAPIRKLKRYTNLPVLLHLLQTRTLTALNPSTWPDQNDTTYLRRYKATHPQVKGLFVLCMTEAADTFHHWNVYANGPSGVKIEFDPAGFQTWLSNTKVSSRLERVQYKRIDEIEEAARDQNSLPFLKPIPSPKSVTLKGLREVRKVVVYHNDNSKPGVSA